MRASRVSTSSYEWSNGICELDYNSRIFKATAGFSYNKTLVKVASDHRKRNGQFAVTPDICVAWVKTLSIMGQTGALRHERDARPAILKYHLN